MIILGSTFKVVDNTGVKEILSLANITTKKNILNIGDIIIGVITKIKTSSKLKLSSIIKALIIRTKKIYIEQDGFTLSFKDNAVILLDNKSIPLGSRFFGMITIKSLLQKKLVKLETFNNII